jgi:hypothetical protein
MTARATCWRSCSTANACPCRSTIASFEAWSLTELRSNQVITLPRGDQPPGHLLLVASSELPVAFYTGT